MKTCSCNGSEQIEKDKIKRSYSSHKAKINIFVFGYHDLEKREAGRDFVNKHFLIEIYPTSRQNYIIIILNLPLDLRVGRDT